METQPKTRAKTKARRDTPEERQAKLDAVVAKLDEGVDGLLAGEDFKEYLNLMSRLHTYSANNVMLIMSQCPHATMVMGFGNKAGTTGWKSLGRKVVTGKGSGIRILAPMIGLVDSETHPGTRETKVVGFKPVSVFDVSQTEGDPLPVKPTAKELLGASSESEALMTLLYDYIDRIKWRVFDEADEQLAMYDFPGAKGLADLRNKQIFLKSGMALDQKVKTLCHEAVHAVFHSTDKQYLTRRSAELEAEGASYVVLQHFGIDTSQYSFNYVANWSGGDREALKLVLARIRNTAGAMIEALESIAEKGE